MPVEPASFSIHESIGECRTDDWDEPARSGGSGILMSRGFTAAAEEAFGDQARFERAIAAAAKAYVTTATKRPVGLTASEADCQS